MNKVPIIFSIVATAVFTWASEGYDDLAKLVKAGVSEEVVLSYINSSTVNYALTPEEILRLKDLGASNKVLTAAIRKKNMVNDAQAASTDAAPLQPPKSSQTAVPSVKSDTIVYGVEPPAGRWIDMNDYWYWQYPTGAIIDLGWQPYYYFHSGWNHYGHGGHWGHRGR